MRLRNLILTIAAFGGVAFAQGGHVDLPAIFSQSSSPMQIPSLNVIVCLSTATGVPCSPTVSTFSDQALTQPIANLQTNGDGLFPFWISPGNYQYCVNDAAGRVVNFCNPFTVGVAPGTSPTFAALTVTGNATVGGALKIGGPSPWVDPTAPPYSCSFDDATDDTACLQAAINAVPHGGSLRIPAGRTAFLNCGTPVSNTCILLPYPMDFGGTAMGAEAFGNVFRFPGTVASTVDLFRLVGDANGTDGYHLHDFAIQCNSICGRSPINIDTTTFALSRLTIERVAEQGSFGSFGIRTTNPTPLTNGFFVSSIGPGNVIRNGILLQNGGDSLRIWNNDISFNNAGVTTTAAIDATYVPGAQQTQIYGNNINQTKGGGIHLGSAAQNTYIFTNFFEGGQSGTDVGSNGALIDIDCTVGNPCNHVDIHDNVIQSITTNINNIRVNFANSTNIHDNTISRPGGTAVDIVTTANASGTNIGWNRYEPTGDVLANILTDAGLQTQYQLYGFQSTAGFTFGNRLYVPDGSQCTAPSYSFGSQHATGFDWISGASAMGICVNTVDFAIIAGNRIQLLNSGGYTWTSSPSASGAGNDTGISRSAAGVISHDSSTVGDGLGTSKAAKYQTSTVCAVNSVSPAACGAASSGAFVVPTVTATYTVNTTTVTANSLIFLQPRTYNNTLPSAPTCVAPAITSEPVVSAISAGVSFTLTLASTTGTTCWNYHIVN